MTRIHTAERPCPHTWRPLALDVQQDYDAGVRAVVYRCDHCEREHTVTHDHPAQGVPS
jgi:hypothetical protein